ncbi:MAG: hypothetical protein DMG04_14485 [Acidobacteria bacterium]|nr:MAG: hypothetical protein DMG04_14485 [Acidobacteriota bacterium]PYR11373.1 MAG: hypothetical protein DMF99_08335 [Acidobacteriota bacterium]
MATHLAIEVDRSAFPSESPHPFIITAGRSVPCPSRQVAEVSTEEGTQFLVFPSRRSSEIGA